MRSTLRRCRSASAVSPAARARSISTPSQASSGRRQPCADAVSRAKRNARGREPADAEQGAGGDQARARIFDRGECRCGGRPGLHHRLIAYRQQGGIEHAPAPGEEVRVGPLGRRRVRAQRVEADAGLERQAGDLQRAARQLGARQQFGTAGARQRGAGALEIALRETSFALQRVPRIRLERRLRLDLPVGRRRSSGAAGEQRQHDDGRSEAMAQAHGSLTSVSRARGHLRFSSSIR